MGYWLSDDFLKVINSGLNIKNGAKTRAGLTTWDSKRYYRKHWELKNIRDWLPIANGGSFKKWAGHNLDYLRWEKGWTRVLSETGNRLPSVKYYHTSGIFLSQSARGRLSARFHSGEGFTNSSIAVFPKEPFTVFDIAAWLNNHCASYLVRLYSQKMGIEAKHLDGLPLLKDSLCGSLAQICFHIKNNLISCEAVEDSFRGWSTNEYYQELNTWLLTGEGCIETKILSILSLDTLRAEVEATTGTPAGWYPLITGYDSLPDLPDEQENLLELPQELFDYLAAHDRLSPNKRELARIKANLRALYEAGPGSKDIELETNSAEDNGDEEREGEEAIAGAHIPIPTETFLEELSVKMQLHPISIYWLLEELQATEMVRCLPEEKRLLEDRLSVLVLRLLGHRWPKQIEAFEPVPNWAERDGIIPLVPVTGHTTLAARMREQLYMVEGALGAQKIEALLHELTGQNLEEWLRGRFFERHISQFKKRPIAWHLVSTPPKRGTGGKKKRGESNGPRTPAFECMLYYHACAGDALARIRTQYVEPLLQSERGKVNTTTLFAEDTRISFAQERIRELEEFVERLRAIEEHGFTCHELQEIASEEVLDRWSGDGYGRPENKESFQRGEEAWHVDINDGVRVNIAPLQLTGVLAKEVLNGKDAKKALSDRVRWRADERRWVREGKLPRCGWLNEQVPPSQAWEESETQRRFSEQEQQPTLLLEATGQEEARP